MKVLFGHHLSENDASLLCQCLELITRYSGPSFSVVDSISKNSHEASTDNGDESPTLDTTSSTDNNPYPRSHQPINNHQPTLSPTDHTQYALGN